MTQTLMSKFQKHRFLFEELVKRDFKKKYKRTVLGLSLIHISEPTRPY